MKPIVGIGVLIFFCVQECISSQQLVADETKVEEVSYSPSPILPFERIDEELDQYSVKHSTEEENSTISNVHTLTNEADSSISASPPESMALFSQSDLEFSHHSSSSPGSSQSDMSSPPDQTSMKAQAEEHSDNQSSKTSTSGTSTLPPQNPGGNSSSIQNNTESVSSAKGNSSIPGTTPSNDDVVLKPDEIPSYTKAIFQKSIAWMNDTYTLSIIVPVAAGFVFAAVVIVLVSFVKCVRRRCFRRRFRRKVLPDTIRNMKPSDRARLLADTSDEEF